ncbi:hypothetical protein OIU76_021591 [Salix suchowensis]|nr:hypothetical protein OIU76_021591 [Salix suchowensis]
MSYSKIYYKLYLLLHSILFIISSIKRPMNECEDPPSSKAFLLISLMAFTFFLTSLSCSITDLIPFSMISALTITSFSALKSFL